MNRTHLRTGLAVTIVAGAILLAASGVRTVAHAATPLGFGLTNVSAYGGEPSITSDPHGVLYEASLLNLQPFRSVNGGSSWTTGKNLDGTGDDCVATDQAGSLYMCNLAGSQSSLPLHADVWKTKDPQDNASATWLYGNNPINVGGNQCGTECNPFGVDRPWIDASIPPGGTTNNAVVALMYHDFYGPSAIWVNISTDGGATFSPPSDVLANLTIPNGASGAAVAAADSSCSTIPAGAAIAKSGPHTGRIYVAWEASDAQSAATGCNISEQQPYHNLIVAWSDDNGSTWTPQLAFDAGEFHDMATPFVAFTLDNQGNPYIAFDINGGFSPANCAPDTGGGCATNASSEYDTYVVWSSDGGTTWDGGGGTVPGSAAAAYKVNSDSGTHQFPAIAAGDPGKVDVAWLGTPSFEDVLPNGKLDNAAGGCGKGGPNVPANGCAWDLWMAQSLNLTKPVGGATFTTKDLTAPTPMHVGDICDVGIACLGGRNLADFIQGTVSPTTGCFHVAYADDNKVNMVRSADQTLGPSIIGNGDCNAPIAQTPEVPWTGLLIPVALASSGAVLAVRRRRGVTS